MHTMVARVVQRYILGAASNYMEPHTQAYFDAESGNDISWPSVNRRGRSLLLNPWRIEAREFPNAEAYADFKVDQTNRLDRIVSEMNWGAFEWKARNEKGRTVDKGRVSVDALERKRLEIEAQGLTFEATDQRPSLTKQVKKLQRDAEYLRDFFQDLWGKLVPLGGIASQVSDGAKRSVKVEAYEYPPRDSGGRSRTSFLGWSSAEEDDRGFSRTCKDDLENALAAYPKASVWVVTNMWAHPKHKRKGIGSSMYEALFQHIRKQNPVSLVAPEDCLDIGGTEDEALRVWDKMYSKMPHIGRYIVLT